MLSTKARNIVLGTIMFSFIINTKFPYIHIKHQKQVAVNKSNKTHGMINEDIVKIDNSKDNSKEQDITYNNDNKNINERFQESLHKNLTFQTKEKEITIQPDWIDIVATAYTASSDECSNDKGITASGAMVSRGKTIAAPTNVPFGTKLFIPALNRTYVVEDRGHPSFIKWLDSNTIRIDIYMGNKSEARKFGVQRFKGYFIKNK